MDLHLCSNKGQMKRILFCTIFVIISNFAFASNHNAALNNTLSGICTPTIDKHDSVFFDLKNAEIIGNYLLLPIFIKSDEVINSVDFAFKFNQTLITYDSLLNFQNLAPFANFNTMDSTLRLTSFDIKPIPSNTKLMSLRFKIKGKLPLKSSDLYAFSALLNGDSCSPKVLGTMSPISAIQEEVESNELISLSSNISTNNPISFSSLKQCQVFFTDLHGRVLYSNSHSYPDTEYILPTDQLFNGIYFIIASGMGITETKKIIIQKNY